MFKYILVAIVALVIGIFSPRAYTKIHHDGLQIHCLAQNIYHEARGEAYVGQVAVANVTLNRVGSSHFPSTICEVVKQKNHNNQCQFSWYCDNKSDKIKDVKTYLNILDVSLLYYTNYDKTVDFTSGALYYHASSIQPPKWFNTLTRISQIGNHIFYK